MNFIFFLLADNQNYNRMKNQNRLVLMFLIKIVSLHVFCKCSSSVQDSQYTLKQDNLTTSDYSQNSTSIMNDQENREFYVHLGK